MAHQKDLDSSGFVVNQEKSNWLPRRIGEWLGLIINTYYLVHKSRLWDRGVIDWYLVLSRVLITLNNFFPDVLKHGI